MLVLTRKRQRRQRRLLRSPQKRPLMLGKENNDV
jgi:hypothetical protein